MRAIILYLSHSIVFFIGFFTGAAMRIAKKSDERMGDTQHWKGDEDEKN